MIPTAVGHCMLSNRHKALILGCSGVPRFIITSVRLSTVALSRYGNWTAKSDHLPMKSRGTPGRDTA